MTCGDCRHSRQISGIMVHCVLFGIYISKEYSGCESRKKEGKHEACGAESETDLDG